MAEFIIKKRFQKFIDHSHLDTVVDVIFQEMKMSPTTELSVLITDNTEIRSMNKQYRGIDQPTDVLSFSNDYIDLETGRRYLGDIAISFPTVEKQAKNEGHSLSQELELLLVHGCLHLMGYDHDDQDSKQSMWEIQQRILIRLNNPIKI